MATWTTVAHEFVPAATALSKMFRQSGYSIAVEKHDVGFPYTPAFVGTRQNTTLICEIGSSRIIDRLDTWRSYACSCGKDTRIVFAIHGRESISQSIEQKLRQQGIGLRTFSDEAVFENLIDPVDLALNVTLPDISLCKQIVRASLTPAFEQIKKGDWREGFESACQAVEAKARNYLKQHIRRGRVNILDKSRTAISNPSNAKINTMTLGALGHTFDRIQTKNHADVQIGKALLQINRDRVGVAHHKQKKSTENRLRKNVGRHIWTIVAAMKALT